MTATEHQLQVLGFPDSGSTNKLADALDKLHAALAALDHSGRRRVLRVGGVRALLRVVENLPFNYKHDWLDRADEVVRVAAVESPLVSEEARR